MGSGGKILSVQYGIDHSGPVSLSSHYKHSIPLKVLTALTHCHHHSMAGSGVHLLITTAAIAAAESLLMAKSFDSEELISIDHLTCQYQCCHHFLAIDLDSTMEI